MTLQELKSRATAAELALIEKVEGMLVKEATDAAIAKMVDFMVKNPPDIMRGPDTFSRPIISPSWFDGLKSHLL